ncbi:MAG: hypothetical protein JRI94_04260 [Deltaproteobacteria bacterium]|nr:hypothetical protein [Deltaproteobacteria bacterium]
MLNGNNENVPVIRIDVGDRGIQRVIIGAFTDLQEIGSLSIYSKIRPTLKEIDRVLNTCDSGKAGK